MKGKMIDFSSNGQTFQAYLSPSQAPGPGVIVVQEWWGLNDHIKDLCDRFSSEGFATLAPDLYKGTKTESPDVAGKLLMALNIDETEKMFRGAIDALLTHPSCSSSTVGIVGYCMGGQLALYAAACNPDKVSACVDYYGVHPNAHPPLEKLKAPVLGFFAEIDSYVTPEVIQSLQQTLQNLGKQHEFHTYQGTQHGFCNDTNPAKYNQEAAKDSWKKMLTFFRKQIS